MATRKNNVNTEKRNIEKIKHQKNSQKNTKRKTNKNFEKTRIYKRFMAQLEKLKHGDINDVKKFIRGGVWTDFFSNIGWYFTHGPAYLWNGFVENVLELPFVKGFLQLLTSFGMYIGSAFSFIIKLIFDAWKDIQTRGVRSVWTWILSIISLLTIFDLAGSAGMFGSIGINFSDTINSPIKYLLSQNFWGIIWTTLIGLCNIFGSVVSYIVVLIYYAPFLWTFLTVLLVSATVWGIQIHRLESQKQAQNYTNKKSNKKTEKNMDAIKKDIEPTIESPSQKIEKILKEIETEDTKLDKLKEQSQSLVDAFISMNKLINESVDGKLLTKYRNNKQEIQEDIKNVYASLYINKNKIKYLKHLLYNEVKKIKKEKETAEADYIKAGEELEKQIKLWEKYNDKSADWDFWDYFHYVTGNRELTKQEKKIEEQKEKEEELNDVKESKIDEFYKISREYETYINNLNDKLESIYNTLGTVGLKYAKNDDADIDVGVNVEPNIAKIEAEENRTKAAKDNQISALKQNIPNIVKPLGSSGMNPFALRNIFNPFSKSTNNLRPKEEKDSNPKKAELENPTTKKTDSKIHEPAIESQKPHGFLGRVGEALHLTKHQEPNGGIIPGEKSKSGIPLPVKESNIANRFKESIQQQEQLKKEQKEEERQKSRLLQHTLPAEDTVASRVKALNEGRTKKPGGGSKRFQNLSTKKLLETLNKSSKSTFEELKEKNTIGFNLALLLGFIKPSNDTYIFTPHAAKMIKSMLISSHDSINKHCTGPECNDESISNTSTHRKTQKNNEDLELNDIDSILDTLSAYEFVQTATIHAILRKDTEEKKSGGGSKPGGKTDSVESILKHIKKEDIEWLHGRNSKQIDVALKLGILTPDLVLTDKAANIAEDASVINGISIKDEYEKFYKSIAQ
jgi:hypothetical protein